MDAAPRTTPILLEPTAGAADVVVVGLGANLESPELHFVSALRALQSVSRLCAISPLYRTAPIGPPQPDFLNAAVLCRGGPPLEEFLRLLQGIELREGRVREARWGPRVLDLDILWAGDRIVATSSLTVPHGELLRRAFALAPLLDVFPNAYDPKTLAPYAPILQGLEPQRCERVANENWWVDIDRRHGPQ